MKYSVIADLVAKYSTLEQGHKIIHLIILCMSRCYVVINLKIISERKLHFKHGPSYFEEWRLQRGNVSEDCNLRRNLFIYVYYLTMLLVKVK
jgi:hypothetical protein